MLVLTVSPADKDDIIIRLGSEVVTVKLLQTRPNNKARVGIAASPKVAVNRRSVDDSISREIGGCSCGAKFFTHADIDAHNDHCPLEHATHAV